MCEVSTKSWDWVSLTSVIWIHQKSLCCKVAYIKAEMQEVTNTLLPRSLLALPLPLSLYAYARTYLILVGDDSVISYH